MKTMKTVSQTLRKNIASCFFLALISFSTSVQAGIHQTTSVEEAPLLAIGQVTNVDTLNGIISVNGQDIVYDTQTLTDKSGVIAAGSAGTSLLSAGDYVVVTGELMDSGLSLATDVMSLAEQYVAGASESYLRVIISQDNPIEGKALAGGTSIDYSPALYANSSNGLSAGAIAEFYGSAYGDFFAATDVVVSAEQSQTQAIRGSGVRAIRGSGVRAIRGSGVRAIRGSGVRAIRGSGVRAIRGSGVRAIRGSGVRAIRGSGVRAIRGSGVRSIATSGTD